MKKAITGILMWGIFICFSSARDTDKWTPLLDKDLSKWSTYLSYNHKENYNGSIPKDANGNPITPIGYNNDKNKVFSVINDPSGPILRISGETYGAIFTKQTFKNYHLMLKVRWGTLKFTPRKNKLKDSGILYHSIGEPGVEYWRSWMLSQEFQIMEGHMGDFWCQANSKIDIRSFQSEGAMNRVADQSAPFATCESGADNFCMRAANYETPNNGWTTLELICFEGKSLHIVNGHVVMVLENSRYKEATGRDVPLISGKIQLQSEAAEVFYKDIFIKPLTALPAKYTKLFD